MKLKMDFEHSKIVENIPFIFIFGSFLAAIFLPLPNSYRMPVMFGGMVIGVGIMVLMEQYARVAVSENIVLKARIDGWDIEKEFHCFNLTGNDKDTDYNDITKMYTTVFQLAKPVTLPLLGPETNIEVRKIKIKHVLPWSTRNRQGKKLWVHWNGIEVKSSNAMFVTLLPPETYPRMIKYEIIPEFKLFRGNQDIHLRTKHPLLNLVSNEALTH